MNQSSRKEAIASGSKTYFTGKPCKHGHVALRFAAKGTCVVCKTEWGKSEQKKQYDEIRFKQKMLEDPNYARKTYEKFMDNNPEYHKGVYTKRLEKDPERNKKLYANRREVYKENARQRKRKLKERTFKHERKDILEIYKQRPEGYEVDHEVPINHPLVCGLHCKANLQYLTIESNRIKSNNWEQN